MSRPLIVAVTVLVIAFAALSYLDPGPNGLCALYDAKFQTPLFTGFLTIGGFLLTLKTFVLIQLKKELYETDFYKKRLNDRRQLNPNLSLYGPLNRLGILLIYCVFAALFTAVAQLSIGFIPHRLAAAFCISLAIGTLTLVFQAWFEIRQNLTYWFEFLNDKDKSETTV